jgi:hypothetical protein
MKIIIPIFLFVCITSCSSDGLFGATAGGDCNEICTVYNAAKNILMEENDIFDKNFPNRADREKHTNEISNGFKIESWFYTINNEQDTIYTDFSCTVHYDSEKIEYIVKNLNKDSR